MIYLFCNEGYGLPLIEAARSSSSSRSGTLVLVMSDSKTSDRPLSANSWVRWLRRRRREIKARREHRLPVWLVEDINHPRFTSRIMPTDHGIICGFNQIFKSEAIQRFDSLVNFHPSLLPYYRGPVPSWWCIHNGEARTGFTLHRVTARIDSGEILYQRTIEIDGLKDADDLDRRIAVSAVPTFQRLLAGLGTSESWPAKTVNARAVYKLHPDYLGFPSSSSEASHDANP